MKLVGEGRREDLRRVRVGERISNLLCKFFQSKVSKRFKIMKWKILTHMINISLIFITILLIIKGRVHEIFCPVTIEVSYCK